MRRLSTLLVLGSLAFGCTLTPNADPGRPDGGAPDAGIGGGTGGTGGTGGGTGSGGMDAGMDPPIGPPPSMFVATAKGKDGGAATVDVRATWAAIETLKAGGNAIDAAVAASGMLGLTDPFSCGPGGGGFMLIYLAATGQVVAVDHRETTPMAMTLTNFYENGVAIPFNDLVTSGLSVGVPGTVRGWDEALRRYGTMSFKDVLKYAIYVAEQGFDIDKTFFDQTFKNVDRFKQIESTAKLMLTPTGEAPPMGSIFKNPELGAVYTAIADGGAKAFYEGEIAASIVSTVKTPPLIAGATLNARPGLMELTDLAAYEARVRPALSIDYRGYAVYGVPPPTSGGITIDIALNLLEGFDPKSTDKAGFYHLYLESTRLAYADRNAFLGDPEFVTLPIQGMLSSAYADARRPLIDPTMASTMAAPPGDPFAFQNDPSGAVDLPPDSFTGEHPKDAIDKETTHITVSDKQGNVVSYTCTIESEGGNGMIVPGRGFFLNNELTDFNIPSNPATVHPNVLEPGKRPRSSMSPMIVLKDGKPFLALGSPGGATIITTVMQTFINHIDLEMTIEDALAAPRVSQRNAADATSGAEPEFIATPEAQALQTLGHLFSDAGPIGAATAIRFHADGTLTVAAEPIRRNGGSAAVLTAP
jgi:gamma-glutamyltranspeptidase / glutathione hydrolase